MAFIFLKDCLKKEEYAAEAVYNLKYILSGPLKNICEHLLKYIYIYIAVVVAVYPLTSCFSALAKAFRILRLSQKQNSFYCGFNVHFLDLWWCTSSHIGIAIWIASFRGFFWSLLHVFLFDCLPFCWFVGVIYLFWVSVICYMCGKYFLPLCDLTSYSSSGDFCWIKTFNFNVFKLITYPIWLSAFCAWFKLQSFLFQSF